MGAMLEWSDLVKAVVDKYELQPKPSPP